MDDKDRKTEIQNRELARIRLAYQIIGELEVIAYLSGNDRLTDEDRKIILFYTMSQLREKAKELGIVVESSDSMYRK